MNIGGLIHHYTKNLLAHDTQKSREAWEDLKPYFQGNQEILHFTAEQLIENRCSTTYIMELLSMDCSLLDNENIFKWACAYHYPQTVETLYRLVHVKPDYSSVNAAIINHRLDNLLKLEELGFDIYKEQHFTTALARSNQNGANCSIINYYICKLDKFPTQELTSYSWDCLLKEDLLLLRAAAENHTELFAFLCQWSYGSHAETVKKQFSPMMEEIFKSGSVELLDIIYQHYPDLTVEQMSASCTKLMERALKANKLDFIMTLEKDERFKQVVNLKKIPFSSVIILKDEAIDFYLEHKKVSPSKKIQAMVDYINYHGDDKRIKALFERKDFMQGIDFNAQDGLFFRTLYAAMKSGDCIDSEFMSAWIVNYNIKYTSTIAQAVENDSITKPIFESHELNNHLEQSLMEKAPKTRLKI